MKYGITFFIFIILLAYESALNACTVVIAGRKTTVDGSILLAKSEDDRGDQLDYYWYMSARSHDQGAFLFEASGLKIPQVAETYAYFWDQSPKMMYSNFLINEWGVALGSNACVSKEDPVEKLEMRGEITDGGIGFLLRFLLAERSKTAREAVMVAKELIDNYGYSGSGRCLSIVGPDEAWQLQMVRGKHFVARRVRDDEVVITANTYSIRDIDITDTVNFICSPDIIEYAVKRGWYDPVRDGAFDFAEAYAADDVHTADWNTHRAWMLAKLLNRDFPLTISQAENGRMPVSVIPDRKLSLEDMFDLFRNHFEGTELCSYAEEGGSPHFIDNSPVCNDATHKVNIIQQRNWLPPAIGTVNWRALSHPCLSVFVPWYLGINKIPEIYQKAREDPAMTEKSITMYHFNWPDWQLEEMDMGSAACVFRLLTGIGDSEYKKYSAIIRDTFDRMEDDLILQQKDIEEKALLLYERDESEAEKFLTAYSNERALDAYEKAKELIITLIEDQN